MNMESRNSDQSDCSRQIRITNPEFVDAGFHENCRDESGGIKITDENRDLHIDMDFLIKIYTEEGWGQEEGVTYTRDMTGCPGRRAPTLEVILSMMLRGYKLKGRIVLEGGGVKDCDTENAMEALTQSDMEGDDGVMASYVSRLVWENRSSVDRGAPDPPKSLNVTVSQAHESGIPSGTYHLKDITFKKSDDGITRYSVCDEPKCCFMSHVMMTICAIGNIPEEDASHAMKFFRERKMFTKKDPVSGNFDICYHCLNSAGSSAD